MPFEPAYQVNPRLFGQIKPVERTAGFLEAVELPLDWMADTFALARPLP